MFQLYLTSLISIDHEVVGASMWQGTRGRAGHHTMPWHWYLRGTTVSLVPAPSSAQSWYISSALSQPQIPTGCSSSRTPWRNLSMPLAVHILPWGNLSPMTRFCCTIRWPVGIREFSTDESKTQHDIAFGSEWDVRELRGVSLVLTRSKWHLFMTSYMPQVSYRSVSVRAIDLLNSNANNHRNNINAGE